MFTLTLLLQLFITSPVADTARPVAVNETDVPPSFPELERYVAKYLCWPPGEICFSGTVFISAIIEEDGRLTHADIINKKGIGGIDVVARECYKLVNEMPRWSPGIIKNKPVRTIVYIPLRF